MRIREFFPTLPEYFEIDLQKKRKLNPNKKALIYCRQFYLILFFANINNKLKRSVKVPNFTSLPTYSLFY